jgi:hypothetical protein
MKKGALLFLQACFIIYALMFTLVIFLAEIKGEILCLLFVIILLALIGITLTVGFTDEK